MCLVFTTHAPLAKLRLSVVAHVCFVPYLLVFSLAFETHHRVQRRHELARRRRSKWKWSPTVASVSVIFGIGVSVGIGVYVGVGFSVGSGVSVGLRFSPPPPPSPCRSLVFVVSCPMAWIDQVDWSWWVVFLPTWFVLFGQLVGYYVDYSLAKRLARGTEGKEEEDLTQVCGVCLFVV